VFQQTNATVESTAVAGRTTFATTAAAAAATQPPST